MVAISNHTTSNKKPGIFILGFRYFRRKILMFEMPITSSNHRHSELITFID